MSAVLQNKETPAGAAWPGVRVIALGASTIVMSGISIAAMPAVPAGKNTACAIKSSNII